AWDEGTLYWNYATNYVVTCAEALRTATGSDGGIGHAPAFAKAAEFMQHVTGANGTSFNFADGDLLRWDAPVFMRMGQGFRRADYSSLYKFHAQQHRIVGYMWFHAAHGLIWFDRQAGTTEWQQAPHDRVFRRIETV